MNPTPSVGRIVLTKNNHAAIITAVHDPAAGIVDLVSFSSTSTTFRTRQELGRDWNWTDYQRISEIAHRKVKKDAEI